MWRKMQGKYELKVREQGFKACNTTIKTNRVNLSTILWFLLFLFFFFNFVLL
jgi:hypothetical protein